MSATIKFSPLADLNAAQARAEYVRAKFYIKGQTPEVAVKLLKQLAGRYTQAQLAGKLDVHNVADVLWEAAESNGLIDHYSADFIQEVLSDAIKDARSNPEADVAASESIMQLADWVEDQGSDTDPLIEDVESGSIIGRGEAGIIFGPTGTGKTVVVNEFALGISTGRGVGYTALTDQPIYPCTPGRVLVAVYEAPQDYKRRLRALAKHNAIDLADLNWAIISADLDITRDKDRALLLQRIRADAEKHGAPALVVIDTMPAAVGGKSLNDDDVAGNCYALSQALVREFMASVVFVAHPGKDETRGIAGSYRLQGNADFVLQTVKTKAGFRLMKLKDRAGACHRPLFDYTLQFVEVDQTSSGKPRTGAIIGSIVPCPQQDFPQHSAPTEAQPTAGRKLSPRQTLALDALTEAVISGGATAPAEMKLAASVRVVTIDAWREEMVIRGVIEQDSKNPRAAFKQLKESLAARRLIAERGGLVWAVAA